MGSKLYDFLTDSFLFDDLLIHDKFRSVPENEVWTELQRYRQFCLSVAPDLETEVLSNDSNLKLFSGIRHVSVDLLKQSALYVQQHVLYDPLFALTHTTSEQSKTWTKFLGMHGRSLDKAEVAHTLSYLKELTPMVAGDYVKFLPTSLFFEPPEELPLTYSSKGFAERIPPSLHDFIHRHAIVESGKKGKEGIIFDGSFEIGRIINVRFQDHGFEDCQGYTLTTQEVVHADKANRTVQVRMRLPDSCPDKEVFEAWVYQSINQSAGNIYRRILLENLFSAKYKAFYLTNSPFIFELLEQIVPIEGNIQTNTANVLLNMTIPFLDGVSIETLMKIRADDGEAFENFRVELDKQLRDLRHVKDIEVLKTRTENALHEIAEVQVRQIDQKVNSLKKRLLAEAAVVCASLYGAIQSGGLTLPVALIAVSHGFKVATEYLKQRSENPAFFLWRVLKESRTV